MWRVVAVMVVVMGAGAWAQQEKKYMAAQECPVELRPFNVPITLRITENAKIIYSIIGKLGGIHVLFDPDYNPQKSISVELNGVTLNEALGTVAMASKTFWRPVTPNTIFVAADSRACPQP